MPTFLECFVLLSIFLSLFTTGATFMTLLFVHNVTAVKSRHFFSTVFAVSGLMFFVILLDFGTSVLAQATTLLVLSGCLDVLLLLVVFFLPLLTIRSLIDDLGISHKRTKNLVAVVVLLVVYVVADRVLPSTEEVIVHGTTLDKNVVRIDSSSSAALASAQSSGPQARSGSASLDDDTTEPPPLLDVATEQAKDSNSTASFRRAATLAESFLARAAFFGVIFMAFLGGYAAVSTPRAYLNPFWNRNGRATARHLMIALSRRHRHILELWISKKKQLALLEANERLGALGHAESGRSGNAVSGPREWLTWISNKVTSSSASQKMHLESEIDGLSRVSLSLFMQIHDAEEMLRLAESGRSIKGVIFATFGVLLSFYCVTKMLLTSANLLLWRFSTTDPVTRFMQLVTVWVHLDSASFAVAVSRVAFAFNCMVILSAMRGFLLTTFRITTQYMSAVGANTTVLFFSLCMGLYFIAMLLLMRLSLPEQNRLVVTEVIGELPFYYYHRLNDVCFVISCALTYLVHRFVLTEPTLE